MSDRRLHRWALALISIGLIAKLYAILFVGHYTPRLKWFEFFSIAAYFAYIGWLGLRRRQSERTRARYLIGATVLVLADVFVYYLFRGWA